MNGIGTIITNEGVYFLLQLSNLGRQVDLMFRLRICRDKHVTAGHSYTQLYIQRCGPKGISDKFDYKLGLCIWILVLQNMVPSK